MFQVRIFILIYIFFPFRIIYREIKEEESEINSVVTPVVTLYSRHGKNSGLFSSLLSPQTPVSPSMSCTVEDVLHLLRHLFVIMTYRDEAMCNILDGTYFII